VYSVYKLSVEKPLQRFEFEPRSPSLQSILTEASAHRIILGGRNMIKSALYSVHQSC